MSGMYEVYQVGDRWYAMRWYKAEPERKTFKSKEAALNWAKRVPGNKTKVKT